MTQVNMLAVADPKPATVFRVGRETPDALSKDELSQCHWALPTTFLVYENMFFQMAIGIGENVWASIKKDVKVLFALPGARKCWDKRPYSFSKDFTAFIRSVRTRAEPSNQNAYVHA